MANRGKNLHTGPRAVWTDSFDAESLEELYGKTENSYAKDSNGTRQIAVSPIGLGKGVHVTTLKTNTVGFGKNKQTCGDIMF